MEEVVKVTIPKEIMKLNIQMLEIDKPYKFIKRIGRGGEAIVYECSHTVFGKCVMKYILDNENFKEEELEVQKTMEHPHLLKLNECFKFDD